MRTKNSELKEYCKTSNYGKMEKQRQDKIEDI